MAGLGFKDFAVGEVLTSADVDGYLMQQTVMRFADAGARGSALGTATGTAVPLAEGMISYLQDRDVVELYDGSAWRELGLFAQAVQTVKTDTFSTTSTSFENVTGLTATITPLKATHKVLIIAQVSLGSTANGTSLRLNGGNADDYVGDTSGNIIRGVLGGSSMAISQFTDAMSLVYLDSPATTSATTYAVQMRVNSGTGYVNRGPSESDTADYVRGASSITVLEVRA